MHVFKNSNPISVYRRNKKPRLDKEDEKENDKQNLDQITFFQPPDSYSTMPTGHVPGILSLSWIFVLTFSMVSFVFQRLDLNF